MNPHHPKKKSQAPNRPMGIYRITTDDAVYLGGALDVTARLNRHRFELKFGSHRTTALQAAWNAGGEGAVRFETLDTLVVKEDGSADPAEELALLLDLWRSRLEGEGVGVTVLTPVNSKPSLDPFR
jgi:hypothetical protein